MILLSVPQFQGIRAVHADFKERNPALLQPSCSYFPLFYPPLLQYYSGWSDHMSSIRRQESGTASLEDEELCGAWTAIAKHMAHPSHRLLSMVNVSCTVGINWLLSLCSNPTVPSLAVQHTLLSLRVLVFVLVRFLTIYWGHLSKATWHRGVSLAGIKPLGHSQLIYYKFLHQAAEHLRKHL